MAAEIVQTSQLFARTVAAIEPEWAIAVGPHLCEHRVSAPEWDEKGGRVTAQERVLMHGLELRRGRIDYGRVRPEEATEIFIREALIEGRADITHGFAAANRKLRDKLEMALSRARSGGVWQVAERLYDFYRARLTGISSVHDLNRYVRASGDGVLTAGEADLAAGKAFSIGAELGEFGTTCDPATAHALRMETLPAHAIARCADRFSAHVQGACVGTGVEMTAFAQLLTATSNAWFQLPELSMGIIPGAGGCVSLTRRIGRQRAALMILSGKRIGAKTALDWGLIDAIMDD
jgi:hypothetical protein